MTEGRMEDDMAKIAKDGAPVSTEVSGRGAGGLL